jgi:N-acyl-D-aspartate/D-glutamate deacylase
MDDLIIRNARIYDGTGEAPFDGDLAVKDGRISALGDVKGDAAEIIDADGLALAPGVIDTHTHYDAQVTWDPWLAPSSGLGVTTVLMGNCGFAIAPCRPEHRDITVRNLCNVEGMSLDALRAGVRWDFESFPEYLGNLTRRGVGPNVAVYCGHSAVRTWVMGDDATERAATDDEVAEMADLVRTAMAAGAVGFATSTFEGHNGAGGIPMPSLLAEESEITALTKAMGESGRGMFMLTRGSGTGTQFLESLAEESGRPVMIAALLHNPAMPDATFTAFEKIAAANDRGHELYGQISCCPLTMDFTLRNPYLMESYEAWRPAMAAAGDAVAAVYRDPAFRDGMKAEIEDQSRLRAFNGDWNAIRVAMVADQAHADREGHSVAELAGAEGVHPLDWFLDFGLSENMDTVFSSVLLNSDEAAVGRMLRDPHSSIALSDAGAHLTFFCDAGYALHLYGHWARDVGIMPLEDAVHKLTGRQADIYRIPDRGRLAKGAWADLMLFDPATVARTPNRRVFDLPAGASRLICDAVGLHGVWVNGVRTADQSGMVANGALPGQVLTKFAA